MSPDDQSCEFFRIKNWDKYQKDPYKKKEGIRFSRFFLDTDILDDPKTVNMTALEFMIWIKLLAIARQLGNKIPNDRGWLAVRTGVFRLKQRLNLAYLWHLGLLEAEFSTGKGIVRESKGMHASNLESEKIPTQALLASWNKYSQKKYAIKGFNIARLDLFIPLWEENPKLEYWEEIFRIAAESEFLQKRMKNKPRFEWVTSHHLEISEGKYNDEPQPEIQHPSPIRRASKNAATTT